MTRGARIKIDGHYYTAGEWYPSKKDARAKADRLRKTGLFRGVRVLPVLIDRGFRAYYIYTR